MLDIFLNIPCCWPDKKEREIRRINSDIDKQIKRDKRESKKQYKILLLGAGESGKSTFIRHMRVLHGDGFKQREKEDAKDTIISNLVISVYLIICQMELDPSDSDSCHLLQLSQQLLQLLSPAEESEVSQYVHELDPGDSRSKGSNERQTDCSPDGNTLAESRSMLLRGIWSNYKFRTTLASLTLYRLPDSALYFLSNFERILSENYFATSEDIIRMRRATTGIQETLLQFGDVNFRLVDVGGQRSERRKWIHCFEDVSSIIFIASLAEYNMCLVEDAKVNRLEESIALFVTIIKNPWLRQSSMILFLNKKDIFDEKIQYFDLKDHFPDYNGKFCDSIEAKDFILEKFTNPVKRLRTQIYSHVTIATDPDNVRFVFAAVKHTILSGIVDEIFNTGSDYLV